MFDPVALRSVHDLPARLPVRVPVIAPVTFRFDGAVAYSLSWLREPGLGRLLGEAGRRVPSCLRPAHELSIPAGLVHEVSLDGRGRLRLRLLRSLDDAGRRPVAVTVCAATEAAPSPDADRTLSTILLPPGLDATPNLQDIRRTVLWHTASAAGAIRGEGLSEIANSAGEADPLSDCSFPFAEAGLALFRRALAGDYSWLGEELPTGCESRPTRLTEALRRETSVELHLPFVDRKSQRDRAADPGTLEAAEDGLGRVFVGPADPARRAAARNSTQITLALASTRPGVDAGDAGGFTLSYTDRRRLPAAAAASLLAPLASGYGLGSDLAAIVAEGAPGETVDAEMNLSIPGSVAAVWWDLPGECGPSFFPVYSRVSIAIQQALRRWLPYICFSDPERWDIETVLVPLAVYSASRPFHGRPKFELTQDLASESWAATFFLPVAHPLRRKFPAIRTWLAAAGCAEAAAVFAPENAPSVLASVVRRPRHLRAILAIESQLVHAFTCLGHACQGFRRARDSNPNTANRRFFALAGEFSGTLNRELRRLFARDDFLGLGGLVLLEATAALNRAQRRPPVLRATLRVHKPGANEATCLLASAGAPSPAISAGPDAGKSAHAGCELPPLAPLPFRSTI